MDNRAKVTLITRPRRFGKTLTLSMTKEFFDVSQKDPNLFDNLKIMQAGEKYLAYKNKYPVIFSVMKTVAMLTYEDTMFNRKRYIGFLKLYGENWLIGRKCCKTAFIMLK